MRPVIFSGTTEGRYMSERLSSAGIAHIVCVATDYGGLVMKPGVYADVRTGRLDEAGMEELIGSEADIVFDATHPYASAASSNIKRACTMTGRSYVRIIRGESALPPDAAGIRIFDDAASCAAALKDTEGGILLTTGSKDLFEFAADESVRSRLYARVLPSSDSINTCSAAGLRGSQIIAMQGPFTRELDLALIRQYGIRVLVTKSSGRAGGFDEKLMAASDAGITLFVIGRPSEETGISADDALKTFYDISPLMHIDLVGTGPGRSTLLTAEARDAISGAEVIFGAERMIAPYSGKRAYPYYKAEDVLPVLLREGCARAAVLLSGDTGFYSGAFRLRRALEERLGASGIDHEIKLHPGISSFSYLAARAGIDYSNAGFGSMHGRSGDRENTKAIARRVEEGTPMFILLSTEPQDVRDLGEELKRRRMDDCRIILGRDLSYENERIMSMDPAGLTSVNEPGLYTAFAFREGRHASRGAAGSGKREPLIHILHDDDFIRGGVPMTKDNIRQLSIMRLGLHKEAVFYDIGSGTGSVACQAAALSDSIKVYAIEMKADACDLIRRNAAKFSLPNIEVINGIAPAAFAGLEAPTHAFIGGSSGNMRAIISSLSTAPRDVRVVITAVSLETMAVIESVISGFETDDLSIEQIGVSRAKKIGRHHLMTAENPVMIASFVLRGGGQ